MTLDHIHFYLQASIIAGKPSEAEAIATGSKFHEPIHKLWKDIGTAYATWRNEPNCETKDVIIQPVTAMAAEFKRIVSAALSLISLFTRDGATNEHVIKFTKKTDAGPKIHETAKLADAEIDKQEAILLKAINDNCANGEGIEEALKKHFDKTKGDVQKAIGDMISLSLLICSECFFQPYQACPSDSVREAILNRHTVGDPIRGEIKDPKPAIADFLTHTNFEVIFKGRQKVIGSILKNLIRELKDGPKPYLTKVICSLNDSFAKSKAPTLTGLSYLSSAYKNMVSSADESIRDFLRAVKMVNL